MTQKTPTFDKVPKTLMLLNLIIKTWKHWRNEPLWSIFADVCGVGSNSAIEICNELGLDPHVKISWASVRNVTTQLMKISPTPARDYTGPDYTGPNWDW